MNQISRTITIAACVIALGTGAALAADKKAAPADPMQDLVTAVDTIIMTPVKMIDSMMK